MVHEPTQTHTQIGAQVGGLRSLTVPSHISDTAPTLGWAIGCNMQG